MTDFAPSHPHVLPTRRLLILLLLPAPVMLLWRSSGGLALGFALDVVICVVWAVDLLISPGSRAFEVKRIMPPFLSLNAKNVVGWDVRNASERVMAFALTDDVPEGMRRSRAVVDGVLRPRSRAELRYEVRPTRRGQYRFGDVHLRLGTVLGLGLRQYRLRLEHDVKVYPNVQNLRHYEMALQRHRLQELGVVRTFERGKGAQFDGLREYIPGDDPGDIAWKATARRSKLIVREYGVERSQNILIMLDCGRLMTTQADQVSRLDHAINATILLTYAAMKQGDSIGLLGFSDEIEAYVPPMRGQGVLRRMNEALYRIEARLREPNYDRACRFLALRQRKRSLIIVFTDVIDRAASAALLAHTAHFARRHRALCVTLRNGEVERLAQQQPQAAGDCYVTAVALQSLERRRDALERMRHSGVDVLDVDPRGLTPAVLSRYLDLKRSGRF
ncbi:MAG TPA: DUF58 domain-containing protein [Phycisphaerae bacterium]|mgnify:CR=1 FL=1|nr:DUF58 domain-containing protein [Phycisphaerales bacterium]HRX86707.1 DUF58 domain-containing protein [Phycisphaerae bacterium]